jgi:lambda repressor-like predicted transcriptional regulator
VAEVAARAAGGWYIAAPLLDALGRYRDAREMSVVELAEDLRVDRRTLQRVLRRRWVRSDTADRMAVALGRHPCELWPEWFGHAS